MGIAHIFGVDVPNSALLLTGDWLGTYSYPRQFEPVSFEASLIEFDGIVTGTTSELADHGTGFERILEGHLDGERSGDWVQFSKVYTGSPDTHRSEIVYTGTVYDDGTRIEGTWTIPGNWSGIFKMTRLRQRKISFRRRRWFEKARL